MNETKKWFAVCTRPGWEKNAVNRLSRNKIENYCPLRKVRQPRGNRKRTLLQPLFASTVFVKISEHEHKTIKEIKGIRNLVYWLNKPVVIPGHEIETIRGFLDEYTDVSLQKVSKNREEKVRGESGPLFYQEGQVRFVKDRTVKIVLPSMGYLICAEEEKTNVEMIPASVIKEHVLSFPVPAAK